MSPSRSSKVSLIVMLLVVAVPLALAFIMYFGQQWLPTATTNNGLLLLPPKQMEDAGIRLQKTPDLVDEGPLWSIVVAVRGNCDAQCVSHLHTVRQLHLALGKEAHRVVRSLVTLDAAVDNLSLATDYPNMNIGQASNARAFTQEVGVYIVDPNGNIIMFYSNDQIGQPVLKDLKKLLRTSNIG